MIIKGETIGTITEWHEETFPDATEEGQHSKWDEEIYEVMHARGKKKLEELADLYIVACGLRRWNTEEFNERIDYVSGIASRNGWDAKELWDTVCKKMEKNRKRVWKKTGAGKFHHVDSEDSANTAETVPDTHLVSTLDLAELERMSRFRVVVDNAGIDPHVWINEITVANMPSALRELAQQQTIQQENRTFAFTGGDSNE